jgi:hypothetical protein
MDIETRISNLAFDLDNNIDLNKLPNLNFNLKVLERAIKEYRQKSLRLKINAKEGLKE